MLDAVEQSAGNGSAWTATAQRRTDDRRGPEQAALVVRGGWDGHMPVETTDLFIPFLEANGFEVRVEDGTAVYTDADYMDTVDLIVQVNTMNTIEPEEFAGLQRAVLNGTGMAGWHGGIADSYRNNADYLHMIGGQFAHHAGKDPARAHRRAVGQLHPVHGAYHRARQDTSDHRRASRTSIWSRSSTGCCSDEYNDVLATTTQDVRPWDAWNRPVTAPAIWTRQWGKGRIFVSAPGHRLEIVEDPNVRTIIERGLLWAAR